jgi:thiol-disulfide isomerase/thioredoxin
MGVSGGRAIGVPAAATCALALAACTGGPTPPQRSVRPTLSIVLPPSPTALPEFTPAQFQELLGRLKGKPVVVNIWASWCGPCTAEAPGLARQAREFKGKVQFLGVDIIDHVQPARAFILKYRWPYPSVFDPTGAIRDDLGFIGQPVTLIFDASGKKVHTRSGPIPEEELRKSVEDALSGSE